MRKLIFLAILSLCLISCSTDTCNDRCGTITNVTTRLGLPVHGDEVYEIEYVTDCNETLIIRFFFNIGQGWPGEPNSTLPLYEVGQEICFPI